MIPLSVPDIRGKAANLVSRAVKRNWVSSAGPDVKLFEDSVKNYTKCKYAISTSSGSAALCLSLMTLGIKAGQKVLVPDYTFAATVNAVIMLGAIPVFIDVDPSTWIIDHNILKRAIDIHNPSAIIVVDTLGHSFNRSKFFKILKAYKIPLIEDAAGALGSKYNNKMCSTLADIGIISFNGNKLLTTGAGGMLITDNKKYAEVSKNILRQYRNFNSYQYSGIGFNFNMSNLNAVLGLAQMPYLEKVLQKKKNIAKKYDEYFYYRNDMEVMPRNKWSKNNFWLYSIRLSDQREAIRLVEHLKIFNIESRIFWHSLSLQKPYKIYDSILLGVSEKLSGTVVSIPSSSSLKISEIKKVIQAFNSFSSNTIKPIEVSYNA